jgi:hypothetical protein
MSLLVRKVMTTVQVLLLLSVPAVLSLLPVPLLLVLQTHQVMCFSPLVHRTIAASRSSTAIGASSSPSATFIGVQGSRADGTMPGGSSMGGVGNWSLDVVKVKCSCLYYSLDQRVYFLYPFIVC